MAALSDFFRLIMYPLLAMLCLMGTMYFPNSRTVFVALAFFFALFGVGLLVLVMGNADMNFQVRTYLVPFAQAAIAITLLRAFWRTSKKTL